MLENVATDEEIIYIIEKIISLFAKFPHVRTKLVNNIKDIVFSNNQTNSMSIAFYIEPLLKISQ